MPVVFYILSGIGFFSALLGVLIGEFTLAATVVVSAVFCLGFGYMIALLEKIQSNTKPRVVSKIERQEELPAGYQDSYKGYPFRVLENKQVEVLGGTGTRIYKNWQEFHAAVSSRG